MSESNTVVAFEAGLETEVDRPLAERCWYEPLSRGGRYWYQEGPDLWVSGSAEQFRRWLQVEGLSASLTKEERADGQVMSEIDGLLTMLERKRRVDYAAPLAGWRAGLRMMNKSQVLVTRSPELMAPELWAPDGVSDEADARPIMDGAAWGFPTLWMFLCGLFNGVEMNDEGLERVEQLPRVLDWLQHFLLSIYEERYSTGLCLAIAGEADCGKTLFSAIVQELCGGVTARPYRYMIGQDNFNSEWLQAPLLLVDDENSDTHIQSRLKFAAEMKQIVASRGTRIRGMQTAALLLQPIQRLMICVNLEEERLQVLPPIDGDVRDKMLVLKGYAKPLPMPTRNPREQEAFWKKLSQEMPHFLAWLFDVYRPDLDAWGRFGPKAWQHPMILEELSKLNPETRTWEFIERMLEKHPRISEDDLKLIAAGDRAKVEVGSIGWIGEASDLRRTLLSDGEDAPLAMMERREVRAVAYLGRDLKALSRSRIGQVLPSRQPGTGKKFWIIRDGVTARDGSDENNDY